MEKKILIRFDDVCPTMDYQQFERAIDLIDSYGVKPLVGVIPSCLDKDLMIEPEHDNFWDYVKMMISKGYTIAMHGYEHIFVSPCHGIVNRRIGSEFAGLPLDVQVEKIRKGKAIMESHGVYTDVFFAPAHSYDRNTLKALSICGFKYMSDGKSSHAYILEGIKCLPCRASGAAKIKGGGYYTSVFHAHEWVKPEKAYAFEELKKLLSVYSRYIVPFSEYCKQPTGSLFLQKIDEQVFVFWQHEIRPLLSNVYHHLK